MDDANSPIDASQQPAAPQVAQPAPEAAQPTAPQVAQPAPEAAQPAPEVQP